MSEEIIIEEDDNGESLLKEIRDAQKKMKNHELSFEAIEELAKEIGIKMKFFEMASKIKKIQATNAPKKKETSDDKPKSLRETLKQETKPNETTNERSSIGSDSTIG